MKINRRVDLSSNDALDVRFLEERLQGEYDNVYITFSTIDKESEAWVDQGDSFLSIVLKPEDVVEKQVDFRQTILDHIPLLTWLDQRALQKYVELKMAS